MYVCEDVCVVGQSNVFSDLLSVVNLYYSLKILQKERIERTIKQGGIELYS